MKTIETLKLWLEISEGTLSNTFIGTRTTIMEVKEMIAELEKVEVYLEECKGRITAESIKAISNFKTYGKQWGFNTWLTAGLARAWNILNNVIAGSPPEFDDLSQLNEKCNTCGQLTTIMGFFRNGPQGRFEIETYCDKCKKTTSGYRLYVIVPTETGSIHYIAKPLTAL